MDTCLFFAQRILLWILWWQIWCSKTTLSEQLLPTYITDSCEETGRKGIICDDGFVIKLKDVLCLPDNYTCPEYTNIERLCNGLGSCSNVDIRRQLVNYCMNYPHKTVLTTFHCVRSDNPKPPCRTNVCSGDNIKCPRGSVFHLLTVKCRYFHMECDPGVFRHIHQSCEGQRSCTMAALRSGIPDMFCKSANRPNNVFMDYICVDEQMVSATCAGRFIVQQYPFGILTNPGYPDNPDGVRSGCYWAIYANATLGEEVHLVVHQSFSKEGMQKCSTEYLQVQYTLCDSNESTTDQYCGNDLANVKIHSCGTVYVSHKPYDLGPEKGSRFLVSYQVTTRHLQLPTYDRYSKTCERVNKAYMDVRSTVAYSPPTSTFPVTIKGERDGHSEQSIYSPDELPINDSSISGPESEPAKENTDHRKRSDPWQFVTLLRVVVVNIFIGLLIIALIMAVTFVCYRYRYVTMGRKRKMHTTKSATDTTLDDDKADHTNMQLLSGEHFTDTPKLDASKRCAGDGESNVLTNHVNAASNATYETTIFHFNRSNVDSDDDVVVCDTEKGVSSFVPQVPLRRGNLKQQNAESAYSSFEEDQDPPDVGNYSCVSDLNNTPCTNVIVESVMNDALISNHTGNAGNTGNGNTYVRTDGNIPVHQNIESSGGSDYAVISKGHHQNKQRSDQSPGSNVTRGKHVDTRECDHALYDGRHIHVHVVPEETGPLNNGEASTMHLIPEHNCLLHNIPPPPPPPASRIPNNTHSNNRQSWSSIHAQV